jgi:hypothetical protein
MMNACRGDHHVIDVQCPKLHGRALAWLQQSSKLLMCDSTSGKLEIDSIYT